MKYKVLVLGSAILLLGSFVFWKNSSHHLLAIEKVPSRHVTATVLLSSKKALFTPQQDIKTFMQGQVEGIKCFAYDPQNALQGGEAVKHCTDSEQRAYDVQVSTNKVIWYIAIDSKEDTTKPLITFAQAQEEAKEIMEKDMPGFDTFAKTATYNPEQDSGMYAINWLGNLDLTQVQKTYFQQKGTPPPRYHMQVVLDRYGNLRNFDNEFLGNG